MEKVKELLGWVSTLARNTQSKATSSQTKESADIEKAILDQQVSRRSVCLLLGRIIYNNTLGGNKTNHIWATPGMIISTNVNCQDLKKLKKSSYLYFYLLNQLSLVHW